VILVLVISALGLFIMLFGAFEQDPLAILAGFTLIVFVFLLVFFAPVLSVLSFFGLLAAIYTQNWEMALASLFLLFFSLLLWRFETISGLF